MFHLKSLSCLLTVLAAILLTQKSRIGLLIAIADSLIVLSIGLRSSQPDSICGKPVFHQRLRLRHGVANPKNRHKCIEIKCSDRIEARSRTALR
jgi:hypothetical protein